MAIDFDMSARGEPILIHENGVTVVHPISSKSLAGLITAIAVIFVVSEAVQADQPAPATAPQHSTEFARRITEITDVVLEHHLDPPTRQQMIASGFKSLYKAAGLPIPNGLSRRVSALSAPEQLATFVTETWPRSNDNSSNAAKYETAFMDGILASVPGGARLFSAKDRKVEEQFKGNRYVGIHITLGMDEEAKLPRMAEVFEGGPADRAGAKAGDLIEQINGVDTKGVELRDVVDRLRGEEGTDVAINVRQPNESRSRTMKITRGKLPHSTISGVRKRPDGSWDGQLDGSAPIAYFRISEISASTPHELRKLARQLEDQGGWGVVLDLRGLGGTSLHEAVLLADSLLAGGVIGRVQTAQREVIYHADPDALLRKSPLVVLIDQTTSGTAEWLAAALQDNHRAILVGAPTNSTMYAISQTSGSRGVVRSMVAIGDGSWSIELPTGRLERGDGRLISDDPTVVEGGDGARVQRPLDSAKVKGGVKPDHMVGGDASGAIRGTPPRFRQQPNHEPSSANDEVLREAVRLLRQSLQKFI
jgi:carboxyl-terminal processing protease